MTMNECDIPTIYMTDVIADCVKRIDRLLDPAEKSEVFPVMTFIEFDAENDRSARGSREAAKDFVLGALDVHL